MLEKLKIRTYNYYRTADIKKIAAQAKKERFIRLNQFHG